MANPEHIEIVKQGSEAIRQWRSKNPGVRLELSKAPLEGIKAPGADLSDANLYGALLMGADLAGAAIHRADLRKSFLSGANLGGCQMLGADFTLAELQRAELQGAFAHTAVFWGANLSEANLRRSLLDNSDLDQSILSNADLRSSHLGGANMYRATVQGARFEDAQFGGTRLLSVDLSDAEGLSKVRHLGPCAVDFDTLRLSRGEIPEVFLRGCGLSDEFITYVPSLFADSAIQFYSCFISYSHADKRFARQLHDRLQGQGIRCWLDEHQMKPGDKMLSAIDHGIRVWDKVLLCCSKSSLDDSWWVDAEIDKAFEKERQLRKEHGREILSLIPLNLDGYLLDGWESPKKTLITDRLAADFRGWKRNHDKFEAELEKVVSALRADQGAREPDPVPKLGKE